MHPELKISFGYNLAMDIINQQNMQIQSMQGWLANYDEFCGCDANTPQPLSESCYADELDALKLTPALRALSAPSAPSSPHERSERAVSTNLSAYEVNLRCDLTSTTPRTISVSWSPYPSEVGMYEIDGCVGYR